MVLISRLRCVYSAYASPVRFGKMHIGPIVHRFIKRHPQVQIELLLLDRTVDLLEEGLDLAARIGRCVSVGTGHRLFLFAPGENLPGRGETGCPAAGFPVAAADGLPDRPA